MKYLKRVAATGLLGLTLATSVLAQGQSAGHVPPAKPPFPLIDLPDAKSSGQRAIDLLGDRLPEVAAWYRKSPDELRALLLNDRLLKVDRRGRLFVEDEITLPLPAPPSPAETSALTGALLPLDQTFLLHSKPGANRTIYLNFRGATISNTAWSASTLIAQPFDMDGVPGTFSEAELQRIQYIWQRVVEDFAPFDVDVTTEQPTADRLTRSGSSDLVFGTTVVITNRSGVYSCSCGGVAYLGVFDDTSEYYKPALVFWDALGSGEKNVAEAISHEAGHNMGLNHDGTPTAGYYTGHGSGATGWAPIMGVGYYQPLVQWSKGEYSGANNVQDDYAVMAGNGLPLRVDDHGNTAASATALTGTTSSGVSSLSATGIVERPSDVDVFSFVANAGNATVTLSPASRAANLDAAIELRNAAGTLLASANPTDAINATLAHVLPAAGTYYVSVQGVGKGDPLTSGYTDYGSLGQYALAVTAPTASGTPPVAVMSANLTSGTVPFAVTFSSAGSNDPDGSIASTQWVFGDGGSASGVTASHTYTAPGTYSAELRLTDDSGLTSTQTLTINAQAPVVVTTMRVGDIAMSLRVQKNSSARATAVVSVRDGNGNVVPGATVSGTWSGIVSAAGNVLTGSNGEASFSSPQTRNTGTFVFTVTAVTLAGYTYNAAGNAETSDSVTR
jgi:PKD repeat protein